MNKDRAKALIEAFKYFRAKDIPCSAATAFSLDCVEHSEVKAEEIEEILSLDDLLRAPPRKLCDNCRLITTCTLAIRNGTCDKWIGCVE